ncbi:hypothetical protein AB0C34_23000 [Nocardia sp. NPDC049220]
MRAKVMWGEPDSAPNDVHGRAVAPGTTDRSGAYGAAPTSPVAAMR